jgi:hypothetical protein
VKLEIEAPRGPLAAFRMRRLAWFLAPALGCATPSPPSEPVSKPAIVVAPPAAPAALDPAAEPEHESWHGAFEFELDPPRAPVQQSCKVTSEGKCPYDSPRPDPSKYAYDPVERTELRAVELHLRFAHDPNRIRDLRYMRFRILVEHRELGDELDALAGFVEEHDGHPIAGWAAFLLIDELTLRAFEGPDRGVSDVEALFQWIERLQTMELWKLESTRELWYMTPTLHAATSWQLALAARERGEFGQCADRFLAIFEQYENHDRAATLLANASECLVAAQRLDEAEKVRKQLLSRFPDSDAAKALR